MSTNENISALDFSLKQANDPQTDFKAEVVAAALIEQGFDPEQIVIVREWKD
jgi:hypothetical protein